MPSPAAEGPPRFTCVHLEWPIQRSSRAFKVGVVEPRTYEPAAHADVFYKIVSDVLFPEQERVEALDDHLARDPRPFDLVTFPEAFVPADALVRVLEFCREASPSGCFHTGLRPTTGDDRHLFRIPELRVLLEELGSAVDVDADLSPFREWVGRQSTGHVFNVGAVFAIDANGRVRVCLHPKMVKARAEVSARPELNMTEADLLTLLTLRPSNAQLLTVTMQPLLCSDVLDIETDRPEGAPMKAITRFAGGFALGVPDHVDIVSVPTCTPQKWGVNRDGSEYREWPEQFRRSFESASASADLPRHHFSTFVLSNFRTLDKSSRGGLSGVFLPIPPSPEALHRDVVISAFGRQKGSENSNTWSKPSDKPPKDWQGRGFVAGLDALASPGDALARVFAFTIDHLPRTHSFWDRTGSLAPCEVQAWRRDQGGELAIEIRR